MLIKVMSMDTLAGTNKFKISKNTVTIGSHYRNKLVEKEIPTSYNKFDCLNTDKDVVITNDYYVVITNDYIINLIA